MNRRITGILRWSSAVIPSLNRNDTAVEPGEPPVERGEATRNSPIARTNPATTASPPEIDRRFRQFFVLANNSL